MDEWIAHSVSPTAACGLVKVHNSLIFCRTLAAKPSTSGRKSSGAESVLQLVIGELGQIASYPDRVLAGNMFEVPEVHVFGPGSLDQGQ